MKKHSPNFHTNLEEADKAKNNRAVTFFWTVVTLALFLLGFSLTSCNIRTSPSQDKELLQKQFNHVYSISSARYIVFDSVHVYDVFVDLNGDIHSKVKIK